MIYTIPVNAYAALDNYHAMFPKINVTIRNNQPKKTTLGWITQYKQIISPLNFNLYENHY